MKEKKHKIFFVDHEPAARAAVADILGGVGFDILVLQMRCLSPSLSELLLFAYSCYGDARNGWDNAFKQNQGYSTMDPVMAVS